MLCGEKDSTNKKAATNITEGIIESEIQFIKRVGHEVNIDTPEELARVLNNFYHQSHNLQR